MEYWLIANGRPSSRAHSRSADGLVHDAQTGIRTYRREGHVTTGRVARPLGLELGVARTRCRRCRRPVSEYVKDATALLTDEDPDQWRS